MSLLIETPFKLVADQINSIRADLLRIDAMAVMANTLKREEAARTKSAAYVFLSAALENFVRSLLQDLLVEIASQPLTLPDVRSSLFALVCHGNFASLADSGRERMWALRTGLLKTLFDQAQQFIPSYEVPLDRKTLSRYHFNNIWAVFGFDGDSLPSPLHVRALEELSKGRNDVAHGNIDPITFGRGKATQDVLQLIARIEDIVEHLYLKADDYLRKKGYLRQYAGE